MKAPFPWFGGKSLVSQVVWERFGDVPNYIEPFFGSGAVLLGRPGYKGQTETVNDKDAYLANFWRAIQQDPEQVAGFADNPLNENDLHARHAWLVGQRQSLVSRLEGSPDFYDPKIAGWWVWGLCAWIGSGFCSGEGPWHVVDGHLVALGARKGIITRTRMHLGTRGMGIHRQMLSLSSHTRGITRRRPILCRGTGVHRKRLNSTQRGVNGKHAALFAWFEELASRLRAVRVCCGDWSRIVGPSPTVHLGLTGVFLDPPYGVKGERSDCYTEEDYTVARDVREWALEHGSDSRLRIALCGYQGEHEMSDDWDCVPWKAHGGYGRSNGNEHRERIWFSPHCLLPKQGRLF